MNKLNKPLEKISIAFIYLLVIFIPLQELCIHALESYTHLSNSAIFWLAHFYEPIFGLIFLAYLIKFLLSKSWPKFQRSDLYLLAFLALAILSVLFYRSDLSRGLEGLRFLTLPFFAYLLVRISDYKNSHRLVQVYLTIAIFFAFIAVLEYFLLPRGYMQIFGKLSGFGFGQNSLISVSQATALLAGPNQLASYLMLAFFYLLQKFFTSNKHPLASIDNYFLILVTLAIGLTYSRSALVGLFVGVVLMFLYHHRDHRKKIIDAILFIVVAVGLAASWAMMNGELPRDLITHGSSFSQHLFATKDSFKLFIEGGVLKILFGFGVGSAGPAALKLGGIITENYYLQIIFEVGIIGFALFAVFIAGVISWIYKGSKTLYFAFVALLVNALFLHIFADNPAMAVSIFIIIASVINIERSKEITTLTDHAEITQKNEKQEIRREKISEV